MREVVNIALGDGTLEVAASAASDVGLLRPTNEDSFIADFPVFAVADGMGGHAHGLRASSTTSAVLRDRLVRSVLPTPEGVLAAIAEANEELIEAAERGTPREISGTTLAGVALVSTGGHATHWMGFNVGDSRIYTWDGRTLHQLSEDHSLVQELVAAGELSSEAAKMHPDRNVITRAIGAFPNVRSDIWLIPLERSQTFVICSDGLTKELDDAEIALQLAEFSPGADDGSTVSEWLVRAALGSGGADNVTVVVVEATVTNADCWSTSTAPRDRITVDDPTDTVPKAP